MYSNLRPYEVVLHGNAYQIPYMRLTESSSCYVYSHTMNKSSLWIIAANVGTRCSTNSEDALVHLGTSSKSLKASLTATRNLS